MHKENSVRYEEREEGWYIRCSVCDQEFFFGRPKPIGVVGLAELTSSERTQTYGELKPEERAKIPRTYSIKCTNMRKIVVDGKSADVPCGTQWLITIDPRELGGYDQDAITDMTISPHPESDTSWMEWGRKMLSGTLELLDKRSESMLTLIAALIA